MKTNRTKAICIGLGLLLLLLAFAACAPAKEDLPPTAESAPSATTPASTTPSDPSTQDTTPSDPEKPTGGDAKSLEAQGTATYLAQFNGNLGIAYVTYNGYYNPIEERYVRFFSPDLYYVVRYEYNAEGWLVGVDSYECSDDTNRDAEPYFSIDYTPNGRSYTSSEVLLFGEAETDMISDVAYYENGTIKQWSIGYAETNDYFVQSFSMDEAGRRSKVEDWGKELAYTYTGDARIPTAVTREGAALVQTYTDGKLSAVTFEEDYYGSVEVSLVHTADGKRLGGLTRRWSVSPDNYEFVYEMTYTEEGLLASLKREFYQNQTYNRREVTTYEYVVGLGRLSKQTTKTYTPKTDTAWTVVTYTYDASGNRTRIEEKNLGADGELYLSTKTWDMEYNAAGKMIKRTIRSEVPGGAPKSYTVEEYRYDVQNRCVWESIKTYRANGTLEREIRNELDENGNVTKQEIFRYNQNGELLEHTVNT